MKKVLLLILVLFFAGCGARSNVLYRMYSTDPMPLDNVARVLAYSPEIKAVIVKDKIGNPLLNNGDYWIFAPGSEDTQAGETINTSYRNKFGNYVIELLPNKEYKFWMGKDKYRTIKPNGGEVYLYKPTKFTEGLRSRYLVDGSLYYETCYNCNPTDFEFVQVDGYSNLPSGFSAKHNVVYYFNGKNWLKDNRTVKVVRNYNSGNIAFRYTVENGKATMFENWYDSGQKKTEYKIKNGLLGGELFQWREDGTRR